MQPMSNAWEGGQWTSLGRWPVDKLGKVACRHLFMDSGLSEILDKSGQWVKNKRTGKPANQRAWAKCQR